MTKLKKVLIKANCLKINIKELAERIVKSKRIQASGLHHIEKVYRPHLSIHELIVYTSQGTYLINPGHYNMAGFVTRLNDLYFNTPEWEKCRDGYVGETLYDKQDEAKLAS